MQPLPPCTIECRNISDQSDVEDVCDYMNNLSLDGHQFADLVHCFRDELINGLTFIHLTKADLASLGMYKLSRRNVLFNHVRQLKHRYYANSKPKSRRSSIVWSGSSKILNQCSFASAQETTPPPPTPIWQDITSLLRYDSSSNSETARSSVMASPCTICQSERRRSRQLSLSAPPYYPSFQLDTSSKVDNTFCIQIQPLDINAKENNKEWYTYAVIQHHT
eukprot:946763_1